MVLQFSSDHKGPFRPDACVADRPVSTKLGLFTYVNRETDVR